MRVFRGEIGHGGPENKKKKKERRRNIKERKAVGVGELAPVRVPCVVGMTDTIHRFNRGTET